jgi:hypothetical protein
MVEHLTKLDFLEKVFNFETKKEWEYQGELPAIIDLRRLVRAMQDGFACPRILVR